MFPPLDVHALCNSLPLGAGRVRDLLLIEYSKGDGMSLVIVLQKILDLASRLS